jgi:hypothetical protein
VADSQQELKYMELGVCGFEILITTIKYLVGHVARMTKQNIFIDAGIHVLSSGVGVVVHLAADSQSTSSSGYRASLWDP